MGRATLSRVFSRPKTGASTYKSDPCENVNQYQVHKPEANINAVQPLNNALMMQQKKPTISFDQHVAVPTKQKDGAGPMTPRKHSYASVKEDSEIPQSFFSRRLRLNSQSQEYAGKHVWQCTASTPEQIMDETVLIDDYDEDIAVYSDSDFDSTSTRVVTTLESMPDEILDLIFSHVTLDSNKDRYVDPRVDLFNLLFVSRKVHSAALRVLYKHVKVPQSKAFFKFNTALSEDAHLGSLVQCLDFSHFSSIGFGRARSMTVETPYLTPRTLKACLDKLTNLKAFLALEHVDDELDTAVLARLLDMPSLRVLDLCAASSKVFVESLSSIASNLKTPLQNIQRLSLHECTTLPTSVFENLLPRLTHLTHLDVAHTMINDKALMSLPQSAHVTHLNLERCTQITGLAVVEFLTSHTAVRHSLIYLNLFADSSRYRLLSEDDLTTLLPALPSTLRSLNLGGARVNSSHRCALRALATHLEELGLKGANLSLSQDIAHILSLVSGDRDEEPEHPDWRHNLRYIDLNDVRSVNQMSLTYGPTSITEAQAMPLEVIEVGDSVLRDIAKRIKNVKNPEWVVRELGRRGWYVRQPHLEMVSAAIGTTPKTTKTETATATAAVADDGYRTWKMGARWWGMRKIPMFEQDTGGMYGYFMFKRA